MKGYYFDPKHGGCLRTIDGKHNKYTIHGVYGSDEKNTGAPWTINATVSPEVQRDWRRDSFHSVNVDFTGKVVHHRIHYKARWYPTKRIIKWEDGNYWKQMFVSIQS